MAEYIEREALKNSFCNWCDEEYDDEPFCEPDDCPIRNLILNAPAANVAPVAHGKWEDCDWVEYDGHGECIHYPHKGLVCTNCRNAFKKEFVNNPRVNYCPNCGARMDGE